MRNPIRKFKKIGNFQKGHGFDQKDRRLLNSETYVTKILDLWSKTPYIFDIYIVNTPKTNKAMFREQGETNPDWLKEKSGLEIVPAEDAITLVFVGNQGAEKIPFTGWMMAHRTGHALRQLRTNIRKPEFENLVNDTERYFDQIIRIFGAPRIYPYSIGRSSYRSTYDSSYDQPLRSRLTDDRYKKYLGQQIGTTAACRNERLRNFYEFVYECIAQYIISGRVKLKPLLSTVCFGPAPWGRKYCRTADQIALDEVNDMIEQLEMELNYELIPNFLDSAVGNLYLM